MVRLPLAAALLLALPAPGAAAEGPADAAPPESSGEKAFLDAGSPTKAVSAIIHAANPTSAPASKLKNRSGA